MTRILLNASSVIFLLSQRWQGKESTDQVKAIRQSMLALHSIEVFLKGIPLRYNSEKPLFEFNLSLNLGDSSIEVV